MQALDDQLSGHGDVGGAGERVALVPSSPLTIQRGTERDSNGNSDSSYRSSYDIQQVARWIEHLLSFSCSCWWCSIVNICMVSSSSCGYQLSCLSRMILFGSKQPLRFVFDFRALVTNTSCTLNATQSIERLKYYQFYYWEKGKSLYLVPFPLLLCFK